MSWTPTHQEHPKDGARVEWLDHNDGSVVAGSICGRLWMMTNGVYLYSTPKFWRPL